jgi:hypothetical protein
LSYEVGSYSLVDSHWITPSQAETRYGSEIKQSLDYDMILHGAKKAESATQEEQDDNTLHLDADERIAETNNNRMREYNRCMF